MGIGNTLATFLIKLGLDSSDLDADLKNVERKTTKSMTEMGRNMSKTGLAMTAGVTAPIAAMGLSSINAASDLEESMNAVNVIFGDTADEILDFSKTASQAVGLSSSEFNQLSAELGAMLKNVGVPLDMVS